jgi:hypothetical protein
MLYVIDLFGEKTTRDELGFGGVPEALSYLLPLIKNINQNGN